VTGPLPWPMCLLFATEGSVRRRKLAKAAGRGRARALHSCPDVMSRAGLVAAVLASLLASGCIVSPRGAHIVGNVAAAALWTAAIVGTVTVLAYHDAHYHHDHCGHYRRWHESRWVYYYGGHWEYHEAGTWYVYSE
jgi:hypothetical protein